MTGRPKLDDRTLRGGPTVPSDRVGRWLPWPRVGPDTARALAALGAGWILLFAGMHVYWAAGGRAGIADSDADLADSSSFLAYSLAAAAVLLVGAAIAVVLARRSIPPRRWLLTLTLWAALVAVLRGFVGVVQDGAAVVSGDPVSIAIAYDVWFLVAGSIFVTVASSLHPSRTRHGRSTLVSHR